jgi:hypothetical protein
MRAIKPQTRPTAEIVADIIKALDGGAAIEEHVQAHVKTVRSRVLKDFGPFEGNQRANEEFARRMIKWIDDGRKLKFPKHGVVLEILFGPKQSAPVNSPERLHAVAQQAEANYKDLADRMDVLRQRCEFIIQAEVGEHGLAGNLQKSAASTARSLCEKVGKPLAWSSPTSAYRKVASYFYELMTGEYDRQLKSACKLITRRRTGTEKR